MNVGAALRLRRRINAGETAFGVISTTLDPEIVELCADADFDVFVGDLEHGLVDAASCAHAIRAAETGGISIAFRIEMSQLGLAARLLDAGADGIIVSHVSSRGACERVVDALSYPPEGSRGASGVRASSYGTGDVEVLLRHASDHVVLGVQIEDAEGLQAASEIVAVPRLDLILIGTRDLSFSLGVPGQLDAPVVSNAVADIERAVRAVGKVVAGIGRSPSGSRDLAERGTGLVLVTLSTLLRLGAAPFLAQRRAARAGG